MKNKESILYGIIGLLLGIIIAGGSCYFNHHRGYDKYKKSYGMHMMPDGSMMLNDGSSMGMNGMMDMMMYSLQGKTGDNFDKAFIREMIVHHQGAVVMAEAAQKSAKHAEIKTLADAIISAQTKEIADMKAWYKAWYGEEYNQ